MDTVERAEAISNTGASSPLPIRAFEAVNILEKGGQGLASDVRHTDYAECPGLRAGDSPPLRSERSEQRFRHFSGYRLQQPLSSSN